MHPLTPAMAVLAAGGLAFANLHTVERPLVVSDEGELPGSWSRHYGWPSLAYSEFGDDRGDAGMYSWITGGVWVDVAVAAGILGLVVLVSELATRFPTRRPVIRDS